MGNAKISTKLAFGFGIITVLLVLMSVYSIYQIRVVNEGCKELGTNWMPSIGNASELNTNTSDYRLSTAEHILTDDAGKKKQRESALAEIAGTAARNRGEYFVASEKERQLVGQFDESWKEYQSMTAKVLALSNEGKRKEAIELYDGPLLDVYKKMDAAQRELVGINISEGRKTYEISEATYKSAFFALSLLAVLGTVLAVILAVLIARAITRPVTRCAEALTQGATQVNSAASQVAQSSQVLARGACDQASSLEETSASLEELSSMTRQNADNSRQASTICSEVRQAAERGGTSVQRMNEAITQIRDSSEQTAKILKTIDEIAFQTNLLALNAAVEAARAGDAGKGFAVVAEEVRGLAQRSADAAKNTAALIETGRKNAENGVSVAATVAKDLSDIHGAVQKMSQVISEVSAASDEQDRGVSQINTAVSTMDKTTQSNAATAEEAASAAEELTAQATALNDIVSELNTLVHGHNIVPAYTAAPRKDFNVKQAVPAARVDGSAKLQLRETIKPVAKAKKGAEQVIPLEQNDVSDF